MLDEAEKTIFQISQKRTTQRFVQLNLWLKKTFAQISDAQAKAQGMTSVLLGIPDLMK